MRKSLGQHLLSTDLRKLHTLLKDLDEGKAALDTNREGQADDVETSNEEADGPAKENQDEEPENESKGVHSEL
jgi:hypothetical protein